MDNTQGIREGSVVLVRGAWGRDRPVRARVIDVVPEGKNGATVIDYEVIDTGEGFWAYLYQIDRVITY